jgi:arylsulfatase
LYDCGIKTPLIYRPKTVKPGRTSSLVSVIDLAPTFLELANVAGDDRMQGVSLRSVLEDPTATVRDYAFAEHNWHVYLAHERMLRCGEWLYIRNAYPERNALCEESNETFPAGHELARATEQLAELTPVQRDILLKPRPAEELYGVPDDSEQLRNLAGDPQYAATLRQLRQILDRWTEETGDTVPKNPTPDRVAGSVRRGEFPDAGRSAAAIRAPGPVRGKVPD